MRYTLLFVALALMALALSAYAPAAPDGGTAPAPEFFNGKDLSGW